MRNYRGGNPEYEQYIHSTKWKKIADQRLEQDHHTCCVCGNQRLLISLFREVQGNA